MAAVGDRGSGGFSMTRSYRGPSIALVVEGCDELAYDDQACRECSIVEAINSQRCDFIGTRRALAD